MVRGELGRFPLGIDLVGNVAAYKQYLESKEEGTIISETFQLNRHLTAVHRPHFWGWVGKYVEKLCEILNEQANHMYVDSNRKAAVNSLQTLYTEHWSRKIITERKMRTYITFKSHFQVEDDKVKNNGGPPNVAIGAVRS